jgi:hypothetical protein
MVILFCSASDNGRWQERQSPRPLSNEHTWLAVGGLGFLKFGRDAFGQPVDIRAAQRGDGDFLVRAVNGHRFERRFLGERVHDRAREALPGFAAGPRMLFRR